MRTPISLYIIYLAAWCLGNSAHIGLNEQKDLKFVLSKQQGLDTKLHPIEVNVDNENVLSIVNPPPPTLDQHGEVTIRIMGASRGVATVKVVDNRHYRIGDQEYAGAPVERSLKVTVGATFILEPQVCDARSQTGTVSGKVLDDDLNGVPNVEVTFTLANLTYCSFAGNPQSVVTNGQDGIASAEFTVIGPGKVTVSGQCNSGSDTADLYLTRLTINHDEASFATVVGEETQFTAKATPIVPAPKFTWTFGPGTEGILKNTTGISATFNSGIAGTPVNQKDANSIHVELSSLGCQIATERTLNVQRPAGMRRISSAAAVSEAHEKIITKRAENYYYVLWGPEKTFYRALNQFGDPLCVSKGPIKFQENWIVEEGKDIFGMMKASGHCTWTVGEQGQFTASDEYYQLVPTWLLKSEHFGKSIFEGQQVWCASRSKNVYLTNHTGATMSMTLGTDTVHPWVGSFMYVTFPPNIPEE